VRIWPAGREGDNLVFNTQWFGNRKKEWAGRHPGGELAGYMLKSPNPLHKSVLPESSA